MTLKITIIGGLPSDPERRLLLDRLRASTGDDVQWEWIKANPPSWNIPNTVLRKALGALRPKRDDDDSPVVVKLFLLHGRDQGMLYQAVKDPKLAPQELQDAEELIEWLLGPEAQLIPRTDWNGHVSEAALAALLSKLIKNKSWNKNTQGHAWTQEADLLGQSPVYRPGFEEVRKEAEELLRMADGSIFLSKGGNQGKTPKEWCINLEHVPLVKQMIVARSFTEMGEVAALQSVCRRVASEGEPLYKIDGEIVSERVLHVCRD